MQTRTINPTPWLTRFGINHGIEVTAGERVLFLSGQTATDAEGSPMHAGDIAAQFQLAWNNVKDALAEADMSPSNVVRLNMYTTDIPAFMGQAEAIAPVIAADGCMPVSTLLGVASLFDPTILIELEATAVA